MKYSRGTITYDGIDIRTIKRTICAVPFHGNPGYPPVHRNHCGQYTLRTAGCHRRGRGKRGQGSQCPLLYPAAALRGMTRRFTATAPTCPRASASSWPLTGQPSPRPPVLILDEATSSIDTRTEKLIEKKGMDALMDGRTVLRHRPQAVHGPQLQGHYGAGKGEIIEREATKN